ncbi:hypothetical protein PC129_g22240, partial [Phytophthora cactorum]
MAFNNNESATNAAVVVAPYLAAVSVVDKAKLKLQASIVSTLT